MIWVNEISPGGKRPDAQTCSLLEGDLQFEKYNL